MWGIKARAASASMARGGAPRRPRGTRGWNDWYRRIRVTAGPRGEVALPHLCGLFRRCWGGQPMPLFGPSLRPNEIAHADRWPVIRSDGVVPDPWRSRAGAIVLSAGQNRSACSEIAPHPTRWPGAAARRRVGGYHHHRKLGPPSLDLVEQLQAVHARRVDVGEDSDQRRLDVARQAFERCLAEP